MAKIENLRVVNNSLDTPDGTLVGPTTYFMDVALNEEDTVAVSIGADTYLTLDTLLKGGSPAGVPVDGVVLPPPGIGVPL